LFFQTLELLQEEWKNQPMEITNDYDANVRDGGMKGLVNSGITRN